MLGYSLNLLSADILETKMLPSRQYIPLERQAHNAGLNVYLIIDISA